MQRSAPHRPWTVLGLLAGLLLAGALPGRLLWPAPYEAVARVAIDREDPSTEITSLREDSHYWSPTPFERLESKLVLYAVITNLNLQRSWAGTLHEQSGLSLDAAYALLKRRMEVMEVRGTTLLEIHVRDENPHEAASIADEIARVFTSQALARAHEMRGRAQHALEVARDQTQDPVIREQLTARLHAEKYDTPRTVAVEIIDHAMVPARENASGLLISGILSASGVIMASLSATLLARKPKQT